MRNVIICGTGMHLPDAVVSNTELIQTMEDANSQETSSSAHTPLVAGHPANCRSVERSAGVIHRHMVDKSGVVDHKRMRPLLSPRSPNEICVQVEMALAASRQALAQASMKGDQLGLIILGSTSFERAYPALAIELQAALGASGCAFDLSAACSSATFSLQVAVNAILSGSVDSALVVCTEIPTAQIDFHDPHTRFIFGDGAAAVVLKRREATPEPGFTVLGVETETCFSNTIRNDFGFLNRCEEPLAEAKTYFRQNGVRVLRDVVPMVTQHINKHLAKLGISPSRVTRMWLHQANTHINKLIAQRVLGNCDNLRVPGILADSGNLASAGSLAAFHRFREDLAPGAIGIFCFFGAGYSVGSLIIEKV